MPSKDTVPFKITIPTRNELEKIRKRILEEIGVLISFKKAEIIMREKSLKGKLTIKERDDIIMGRKI